MNTNKMKATITALILAASANTMAAPNSEGMCLALAKMGEYISAGMQKGVTEEVAIAAVTGNNVRTDVEMNSINIVRYVYTTRFDPKTTRNLVYLKCTAGEYL